MNRVGSPRVGCGLFHISSVFFFFGYGKTGSRLGLGFGDGGVGAQVK